MAIYFRSTIWRNYEDQILKAAITKYGLNQWDRISSLLINKTPKQCKNRWFFWLNPRIKKIQWTYEEDERLIYLAYIFISQWNTIGKFLGRTAESCAIRFEKLLNVKINDIDKSLYLQDIKNPCTMMVDHDHQPAKMGNLSNDHDMQNILVEARARLSNIKGKKAKRKNKTNSIYYENFLQKEIFQKNIGSTYNYEEKYLKKLDSKTFRQKNTMLLFNEALEYKVFKRKINVFKKSTSFLLSKQLYKKLYVLKKKKEKKNTVKYLYNNKYFKILYKKIGKLTNKVSYQQKIIIKGEKKNKISYFNKNNV
ncbi:cell division control protein, CDC5 (nucleomorph) [Lotharella oceanica]|uniref:Cell division control protein, CDC5 n=1 Tax=Lotharella oceanica TaxID=641309 RepID=A0A060D7W5_9EUKA|nr:cell division control protein, CDC5 [Lotharella oceanica]